MSCSSRERDLEIRPTPVLRDLLLREAAIDACVGSKVTAGRLVVGVGVVGVVGDAPPWLVGGTLLLVSMSGRNFAIGLLSDIDGVLASKGVLTAWAAENVGVNDKSALSPMVSPSEILWSELRSEFSC
jgi:hypothetical protein